MMEERIEEALNDQHNAELYSAYLYLSMASYFEHRGLPGFAHWMKIQVQEELIHAMKFYDFINERGGRVILKAIEGPPTEWENPLDLFEAALKHEIMVTKMINDLMELAISKKDHATQIFLQWFVTEQVEEESSFGEIVQRLRLIGEARQGLFMMDRELGQRIPPIQLPQTQ